MTDRVNGMIGGNRLSFKVNNTNLGGDPAQGQPKQLAISWVYGGRQRKHVWREGEYVNLPWVRTTRLFIISIFVGASQNESAKHAATMPNRLARE